MASAVGINLGSQSYLPVDTVGTLNYGISKIDISPFGASGTLFNGTVGVSSIPQVSIGTLPTLNITSGSINGTVNIGNTPSLGTIGTLGTALGVGSVGGLGTLPGVGVVSSITNGSINIPNGTLQALGTLGTVGTVAGLGTLPGIGIVTALGTMGTLGTLLGIGSIANIGTINNAGTINAGTINTGTINTGTFVYTGGTLNLIGTLQAGTVVNNGGSIQLYDTSGSIANILTSVGTAAQQNAQLMAGAYLEKSGSLTGLGTILAMDVSNYRAFSLQVSGTFVGSMNSQISDNNVNFVGQNLISVSNTSGGGGSLITSNNIYNGVFAGRYFQVGMTNYTSGTANLLLELYTNSQQVNINNVQANQGGAWNIGTLGTLGLGTITGNLGTMGTLGTITNLGQIYNAGTLQAGTISTGTFQENPIPTSKVTNTGTTGTAGAGTTFGTIQGTVSSGTEIILSDVSIVALAGTPTVALGWGTAAIPYQGTMGIEGGVFPAGGGIAKVYTQANHSGTNGFLTYGITGGTAYFKVGYQVIAATV